MPKKFPALVLCCALLAAASTRPALADTPTKSADEKARAERVKSGALKQVSDAKAESALPNVGTQAPTHPQASHLSTGAKIAIGVGVAAAVVVIVAVVVARNSDARPFLRF